MRTDTSFDSYAELRDWFRDVSCEGDVRAVVFASNEGNFCSGGDVHDIIGPLTRMSTKELLAFTRMTGDLVKAMVNCGKPVIAAVDGVCVGAGAIIAMAADMRIATYEAKCAFLFTRVGLAGCDMGACAILPRIIGQGRAAELLYTGRSMSAEEGVSWGFRSNKPSRLKPRPRLCVCIQTISNEHMMRLLPRKNRCSRVTDGGQILVAMALP